MGSRTDSCSCNSWTRARTARACRERSAADLAIRSDTATVTSTPLSGWRGRDFFSSCRNPPQVALSLAASLSCVTKRPAVSISTAWSVNHQSQLRVPPTPRTACSPIWSAKGNRSPALRNAVVLPDPGAPMMVYQGSS
jgi:hypothetical protein